MHFCQKQNQNLVTTKILLTIGVNMESQAFLKQINTEMVIHLENINGKVLK